MIMIFTEYRGRRYLIDRFQTNFHVAEGIAMSWKNSYPGASFFVSDKPKSHYHFDGGGFEFMPAYRSYTA